MGRKRSKVEPPAERFTPHATTEQMDAYRNFLWAKGARLRKRQTYFWGMLRRATFERDRFRCTYCGAEGDERSLEVDHDWPRARGTNDHPRNLRAACRSCNRRKRARTGSDVRHAREAEGLQKKVAALRGKKRANRPR